MGLSVNAGNSAVPLEAVISTAELARRPARSPDDRALSEALVALSKEMANSPAGILQKLSDSALALCLAHSSGISLLEEENGSAIFRWHAISGAYAPHLWGTTPRNFSPCGTVLDRDAVQLMSHPDRHFEYFAQVDPRIVEGLLVPFHVSGKAVGTVWVISHDDLRKFDAEDARVLNSLGEFAAAAYQILSSLQSLTNARSEVEQANAHLLDSNQRLRDQMIERERAEQSLREEQESLRLACDVAGLGTWQLDLDSGELVSSDIGKANFGLRPEDDLSQARLYDLVHPADREKLRAAMRQARENDCDCQCDFRCLWPDGGTHWISFHGRTFYAPEGRPLKMVGITLDITQRRQAEEQLRHTQKWESLGVLAGGIAHDFNNLLTGVMGNASLITAESLAGSRAAVYAENIVEASERAARLTSQMLAYSGKGRYTIEPIDLSDRVRKIFTLLHPGIPKEVDVRLELASDLPSIRFDAGQLQQLVTNLVQNAAEAIGPAGGTVTVKTSLRTITPAASRSMVLGDDLTPGPCVVLEVSDTGVGMDEATLSRVFDPFFTTKFMGRGLGLAAAAGIVKGHKGGLKVQSAPGKGTTFAAFFSAIVPAQTSLRPRPDDQKLLGRILVVDDEEIVRAFVKPTLEAQHYRVLLAENGREAVSIFEENADQIDLVLLDLKMPVMGGDEALPILKRLRPDIKVILTSGYEQEYALGLFGDTGAAGFLKKPYRAADLKNKIREVLQSE